MNMFLVQINVMNSGFLFKKNVVNTCPHSPLAAWRRLYCLTIHSHANVINSSPYTKVVKIASTFTQYSRLPCGSISEFLKI